jgi:hypothetical protein
MIYSSVKDGVIVLDPRSYLLVALGTLLVALGTLGVAEGTLLIRRDGVGALLDFRAAGGAIF